LPVLSHITCRNYRSGDPRTHPLGSIYLIGRYYDPQTGQFLGLDPLVEQTQQAYEYAGDDPVNGSDPSGLGKPQAPNLNPAEERAVANKEAGQPYNKADYNSAQKKLRQGGKYRGEINVQKRQSNMVAVTIPPYQAILMTGAELHTLEEVTLVAAAAGAGVIIIVILLLGFL
jgi:RHS repeat-associated protein